MTDGEALRHAVLADPDDDLPRLVYADWLDEAGGALPGPDGETAADRAAFVRAQVEAARAEPHGPAARAAAARADALLAEHHRAWTRHLGRLADGAGFARGFVEHLTATVADFPNTAAGAFAAEPVRALRVVRPGLRGPDGWAPLGPVFDAPELQRVRALDLRAAVLSNSLEYIALAESPNLLRLTDLSLKGNPASPMWFPDFLAGPALPDLAGLDVSDIPNLGPAVAAGLERAAHRRLARLDVSGVVFRSGDLQRALAGRCLRGVEELRLGWSGPDAGPLTHLDLGWVIPWDRLRLLDLAGQGLGPEGVREIARRPAAGRLRWLGLAGNGLGPAGAALLADAPHLALFHLDVRCNGLTPRDAAALRARFPDAVVRWE